MNMETANSITREWGRLGPNLPLHVTDLIASIPEPYKWMVQDNPERPLVVDGNAVFIVTEQRAEEGRAGGFRVTRQPLDRVSITLVERKPRESSVPYRERTWCFDDGAGLKLEITGRLWERQTGPAIDRAEDFARGLAEKAGWTFEDHPEVISGD